jgi:hypothetical protein
MKKRKRSPANPLVRKKAHVVREDVLSAAR